MIKLDPNLIGKEFPVCTVAVTAEDIRTFAEAVDDLNPVYLDLAAAQAAVYPNVIAPPLYCMKMRGGRMRPDVPLEPGFIGVFQFVGQQAMMPPFGAKYNAVSALAITLTAHLTYYFLTTTLGIIGLWRLGESFGKFGRMLAFRRSALELPVDRVAP